MVVMMDLDQNLFPSTVSFGAKGFGVTKWLKHSTENQKSQLWISLVHRWSVFFTHPCLGRSVFGWKGQKVKI